APSVLIVMTPLEDVATKNLHQYAEKYVLSDLQEIIEGSFDGILVSDGEGNVQMVNQSYVRNTGITKEELFGHNMMELVNPVWMKESVTLIVRDTGKVVSREYTTKNGKNIIVTGTPIFDKNKKIKKIVINSRDISEIYSLSQQLDSAKKMEQYYRESLVFQQKSGEFPDDIVIVDPKMEQIFRLSKKLGNYNTSVLLTGESGVGKDEVARFIHKSGIRSQKKYIAINCGAIPENLLESELFGYEAGTFTGALRTGKKGIFETANEGTLFLDEIGEMPLGLQVKLLRVLENREITRLGGTNTIPVDVRILAATNKNLSEMVKNGKFREDLLYRLNVVKIAIPPLRERKKDIPLLCLKFVYLYNAQYQENKKLSYPVIEEFERYDWPGNVRELKNVIENMFVLSNQEYFEISPEHEEGSLNDAVERLERGLLQQAQEMFGSTRKIAQHLQLDQSTVVRKLKKYGL
ncbi:MAG: sigma 54-interacting transcriptional regulator, partial [Pygmaiobacter sp.]